MSHSPYKGNIEAQTIRNRNYRKVIFTVPGKMQLVLMSLLPKEEIGAEVHPHTAQFIRVDKGVGTAIIGSHKYRLKDGDAVIIPPRTRHNIINTSKTERMQLYTIYSRTEHKPGTVEKVKLE
jgi:mannose-6-phosphate isomerase-like protein (cupin superfamily)